MVNATLKRERAFNWNITFETDQQDGQWFIYYYSPNGVDMYKIRLSPETLAMAKDLISQIKAWMAQEDEWSGVVVEHWKKEMVVHLATQTEEWVKK